MLDQNFETDAGATGLAESNAVRSSLEGMAAAVAVAVVVMIASSAITGWRAGPHTASAAAAPEADD